MFSLLAVLFMTLFCYYEVDWCVKLVKLNSHNQIKSINIASMTLR